MVMSNSFLLYKLVIDPTEAAGASEGGSKKSRSLNLPQPLKYSGHGCPAMCCRQEKQKMTQAQLPCLQGLSTSPDALRAIRKKLTMSIVNDSLSVTAYMHMGYSICISQMKLKGQ